MKYMIMMFGGTGMSLADRSPEWIKNMHESIMKMDTALRESHLLERAGDPVAARASYLRAAALAASVPEQRYLTLRATRVRAAGAPARL